MSVIDLNRLQHFPQWRELFPDGEPENTARVIEVGAGESLFRCGEACQSYLLILEGEARVQKLSENGQVITLYHLRPGQACELTTACLLSGKTYPADAIADTPLRAVRVSKFRFQKALARSAAFRKWVFSAVDSRIENLVALVGEVSFGPMDRRIARCLLQWSGGTTQIRTTHSRIAEELGTAREVVSRILKEFERSGWIRLHRGAIDIIEPEGLRGASED
jgi:CRP/FNR family transcriptional regulator